MLEIETLSEFENQAGEAAAFLKVLANEHRLLVLCHLVDASEASVTALAAAVGLSQSALSQHLAKLREDGLVSFRRDSQNSLLPRERRPRLTRPRAAQGHLLPFAPLQNGDDPVTLPREISPAEAADLVRQGALLVDIREAPERQSGFIPGAAHAPLSSIAAARIAAAPGQPIIFHCKGGGRTKMNAAALKRKAGSCEVFLLQGGIEEWRAAGLPVDLPK